MSARAARMRAAREAFELAMTLGCLPRDAALEMRRRRIAAIRACGRAATPKSHDTPSGSGPETAGFAAWNNRWMMRE